MKSAGPVSVRALNRSLLERHLLLRRRKRSVGTTLEYLVGLHAQVPRDPYVALWSRLDGFRPEALARMIEDRTAVRGSLMRATLHVVTARDYISMKPVLQSMLETRLRSTPFAKQLAGIDLEALLTAGRGALEERPLTRAQLSTVLVERFPRSDSLALAYAVSYLVPLVQVPPRGVWGKAGQPTWTTGEAWLGRPVRGDPSPDALVRRYLRVFGPSTATDVQSWSGLAGARDVLDRLRPRLRTLRDDSDRELFDVRRAPFPDPATAAPVRFLPEYDNVLLGHKDRSRIVSGEVPQWTGAGWGPVLVDGFTAARWRPEAAQRPSAKNAGKATLRVETFERLAAAERDELIVEGRALVRFLAPDASKHAVDVARMR